MLKVHNIHRSFGTLSVLRGVSFEVKASSRVGLIGPGGGGKSTLLKIIGRVCQADQGSVECLGAGPGEISLMFQEGALFDSLNVFDNVAFPLVAGNVPTWRLPRSIQERVHEKVDGILARVGLSEASQKMPGQLSGGMRRRVSLARALVGRPKLLMLDDPTCGLDPVASSVIMDLVVEIQRDYQPTLLIVSHDLRRLLPVVDIIVGLFEGKVRFIGSLEQLRDFDCPNVRRFVSCRFDIAV